LGVLGPGGGDGGSGGGPFRKPAMILVFFWGPGFVFKGAPGARGGGGFAFVAGDGGGGTFKKKKLGLVFWFKREISLVFI